MGPGQNRYLSTILTLLESGALFAGATIVVVSLYLSGKIETVVAIDSVIQLAVCVAMSVLPPVVFINMFTDNDASPYHVRITACYLFPSF